MARSTILALALMACLALGFAQTTPEPAKSTHITIKNKTPFTAYADISYISGLCHDDHDKMIQPGATWENGTGLCMISSASARIVKADGTTIDCQGTELSKGDYDITMLNNNQCQIL